jgi:hypothetical protein
MQDLSLSELQEALESGLARATSAVERALRMAPDCFVLDCAVFVDVPSMSISPRNADGTYRLMLDVNLSRDGICLYGRPDTPNGPEPSLRKDEVFARVLMWMRELWEREPRGDRRALVRVIDEGTFPERQIPGPEQRCWSLDERRWIADPRWE